MVLPTSFFKIIPFMLWCMLLALPNMLQAKEAPKYEIIQQQEEAEKAKEKDLKGLPGLMFDVEEKDKKKKKDENPFSGMIDDDLIYKVSFGTAEDVSILLGRGANANAKSPESLTALHIAAARSDDEALPIAKLLVEHQASIDAKDKKGNTPLHAAIKAGRTKMVWWLLTIGADFYATDANNLIPHQLAEKEHQRDIATLLKKAMDIDNERKKQEGSQGAMLKSIHHYAYYHCALSYLNYYRRTVAEAKDMPGFSEDDFKKREEGIQDYYNYVMRTYSITPIRLDSIGKESRSLIKQELDALVSNRERKRVGFGKQEDLEKRCNAIAQKWQLNEDEKKSGQ